MARDGLDTDTRLVVVIAILIVMVILIGSTIFYFRKKENDTLDILFRLEDRINRIEMFMQKQQGGKPLPAEN